MAQKDKTYLLRQNSKLFEATLNEFSSLPFSLASTNAIIKDADYNKGSFYYRFKTKEDLYYALIDYVYTIDLSIFRKQDIELRVINNFETLVNLLFEQMRLLWLKDRRYYLLLQQLYHESDNIKQGISQNCIESVKERVVHRIIDLNADLDKNIRAIMISSLNHLVYNYFDGFDSKDFTDNVRSITDFLNQEKQKKIVSTSENLEIDHLLNRLNYIVTKKSGIDLSFYDTDRLSLLLINKTETLTNIRNVLKIKQVTLTKVIASGLKKNLKDLSIFAEFVNLDYADTSYHLLSNYQRMVLILTFLAFIGKETILIDYVLEYLKVEEIKILLQDILPKIAKISKIVVVESIIYPFYTKTYTTFLHKNAKLYKLSQEALLKTTGSIEIQYLDRDILKTKSFLDYSFEMLTFLKNHVIHRISSNILLSFQDISEKGV